MTNLLITAEHQKQLRSIKYQMLSEKNNAKYVDQIKTIHQLNKSMSDGIIKRHPIQHLNNQLAPSVNRTSKTRWRCVINIYMTEDQRPQRQRWPAGCLTVSRTYNGNGT